MENAFISAKYLFAYTRRERVPSIAHDKLTYIDLTYCLEGKMEYEYNGEYVELLPGDAIFFPVGSERVRYFNANPNNYASFNVVLREPFESEVGGYIPKAVMPDTVYMLDTFKHAFNSVSAKKQEKCASIFSYLYYQIVEAVKDRENSHIKLAKQYMLSHLSEDVRLEEIANEVHLAPNYLCSVFKKDTGKTIMQYLAEQRIDLAKRLILTQSEELYKISELCGFSDYNHFSHTFKKISGVSPMFYRKIKNKK